MSLSSLIVLLARQHLVNTNTKQIFATNIVRKDLLLLNAPLKQSSNSTARKLSVFQSIRRTTDGKKNNGGDNTWGIWTRLQNDDITT